MFQKELTLGELARLANCSSYQAAYIIRSRGIRPAKKAGNLRVFTEDDLNIIREERAKMASRKMGGSR